VEEIEPWLETEVSDASQLQRPLPDDALLQIVASSEKRMGPSSLHDPAARKTAASNAALIAREVCDVGRGAFDDDRISDRMPRS